MSIPVCNYCHLLSCFSPLFHHFYQHQVVSTKIEVNRNYVGNKAFQAYQMVASSQIMNVRGYSL